MDIVHKHNNPPGSETPTPDMLLARVVPLVTLEENLHNYTVLQLLEMGLNYIHESAHALYLKHIFTMRRWQKLFY